MYYICCVLQILGSYSAEDIDTKQEIVVKHLEEQEVMLGVLEKSLNGVEVLRSNLMKEEVCNKIPSPPLNIVFYLMTHFKFTHLEKNI